MSQLLYLITLAVSLSLDSFGIGASYGIRKIKIPILSMLTMSTLTFFLTFLSISLGKLLNTHLSDFLIRIFCFVLLTSLSISMVIPSKKSSNKTRKVTNRKRIFSFFISCIGITITIIKEPLKGDSNNSKIIEFREAVCIGTALSLDSFCACLGFSSGNTNLMLPLFISVFQFLFMYIGEKLGKSTSHIPSIYEKFLSYIPPLILMIIAIMQFIQ